MNVFKHTILSKMTLATVLALSGTVMAAEANKRLNLSSVDFNNPWQVQKAYDQIQLAARRVCRDALATWDAETRIRSYRNCVKDTTDRVVQDIDRVELTALHNGNGQRVASK